MMHGAHYLLHLHTRTHKLVFPRPLEISCCTDKVWSNDRQNDSDIPPSFSWGHFISETASPKRSDEEKCLPFFAPSAFRARSLAPPSFVRPLPIKWEHAPSCPISPLIKDRLPSVRLGNVSIFVIAVKALQVRKGVFVNVPSGEQQCCDGACMNSSCSPQMHSRMTDRHLGVSATRPFPSPFRLAGRASTSGAALITRN